MHTLRKVQGLDPQRNHLFEPLNTPSDTIAEDYRKDVIQVIRGRVKFYWEVSIGMHETLPDQLAKHIMTADSGLHHCIRKVNEKGEGVFNFHAA